MSGQGKIASEGSSGGLQDSEQKRRVVKEMDRKTKGYAAHRVAQAGGLSMKDVLAIRWLSPRAALAAMLIAATTLLVGGCLSYSEQVTIEGRKNGDLCEYNSYCESQYCSPIGRCWDKKPEALGQKLWYGDYCEFRKDALRCASNLYCNELQRCVPIDLEKKRANGSECDKNKDFCAKKAVCVEGRIGNEIARCRLTGIPLPDALPTDSKACHAHEQCASGRKCVGTSLDKLTCSEEVGKVKEGKKCTFQIECAKGLYCAKKCVKKSEPDVRKLGSSCESPNQCDTEEVKEVNGKPEVTVIAVACAKMGDTKRCYKQQEEHKNCIISEQCRSKYCNRAGRCEKEPVDPLLRPDGGSCENNDQCYSGRCDMDPAIQRNKCLPPLDS